MILEQFLKADGARNIATAAMQQLRSVNFFGVLMDLAFEKAKRKEDGSDPNDAYRAAFLDGYRACAEDVCYFDQRFNQQDKKTVVRPDFGALDKLLEDEVITKEEYDKLKRERDSSAEGRRVA